MLKIKHITWSMGLLILCSVACSKTATIGAPAPGENGLDLLAPAPSDGIQLRLVEPTSGATSGEHSSCRNFIVPADMDVATFEHAYTAAGVFVAVYRVGDVFNQFDSAPDGVDTDSVTDCSGVPGPVVYIRSSPAGKYTHPDGIAVHLPKGTVLRLETHWLMPHGTNDSRVNLLFAKGAPMAQAGELFMYDFNIFVPPMGTATAKMRCQIPQNIVLTDIEPLTHVSSTGIRAFLSPPTVPRGAVTSSTSHLIFRSAGFNGGMMMGMGGKTSTRAIQIQVPAGAFLDFECDYANRASTPLVEGPGALTNESCAFVANYYPRMVPAAEMCLLPGSGSFEAGGKLNCLQTVGCQQMMGGPRSDGGKACALNVCPGPSQDAFNGLEACVFQFCQTCGTDKECSDCTQFFCGNLLTICSIAPCPPG